MDEGSRWERWPYQALGVALVLVGLGPRLLPSLSPHTRSVATIVGFPVLIAGVVLLGRSSIHRLRQARAEEIRRNPSGTTAPLDDRLRQVDRPRLRWAGALAWALTFSLATTWAIYVAVTDHKSAFVGFAIFLGLPAAFFWWATWRMRALRHRRP